MKVCQKNELTKNGKFAYYQNKNAKGLKSKKAIYLMEAQFIVVIWAFSGTFKTVKAKVIRIGAYAQECFLRYFGQNWIKIKKSFS